MSSSNGNMRLKLHVWRQRNATEPGKMVEYAAEANEHMSFLEMLDNLNEHLVERGEEPIAFDHDCREGICGSCGFMINGVAHGPLPGTTVCQLHMRHFKDGDELWLEPWRARAFPIVKDLAVSRSALGPDHCGGRIHLRADRQRAGRKRHSGAEAEL